MINKLCKRYSELHGLRSNIEQAIELLLSCVRSGHKIMLCGNGGSAADAEHIVGELMKGFLLPRPLTQDQQTAIRRSFPKHAQLLIDNLQRGIPALSLVSGVALPTAYANDVNAEFIFAQQVLALGQKGDILWGISTSGNSHNVNHAFRIARTLGIHTLGLTGRDGGEMATLCDVELRVPVTSTPHIQELHVPIYHTLCAVLEENIFNKEG